MRPRTCTNDGVGKACSQPGKRGAVVETARIEEVGADAPGLQREAAEAQVALPQGQFEKAAFVVVHRRIHSSNGFSIKKMQPFCYSGRHSGPHPTELSRHANHHAECQWHPRRGEKGVL